MNEYTVVDIANPKSYAHPEKFDELFSRLRREEPISWAEPEGYRPFWVITKFADVVEIETKPQIFLSAPQPLLNPKAFEDQRMKQFGRTNPTRTIIQMDPPDHALYRNLTQTWFNPKSLLTLKDTVREIARESINKMKSYNGACDFVQDIAKYYSLHVIMLILGLPREDEEFMLRLTQQFLNPQDSDIVGDDKVDVRTAGVEEMKAYFKKIIQDRIANPTDDLSTFIANATIDDKPIPELEQISYFILIATAGHETTSATVAGSVLAFIQNPDILQQLKNDPGLIPGAVEEMFRWIVPTKTFIRTAAEDYEIRGQKIKAGDRLVLCYQSACRDEETIEDPFTLKIDRKPNRHLAFGCGPHVCLGQHLARLEVITYLEELLPRLESVDLNGEFSYVESSLASGLKKFPIQYQMK